MSGSTPPAILSRSTHRRWQHEDAYRLAALLLAGCSHTAPFHQKFLSAQNMLDVVTQAGLVCQAGGGNPAVVQVSPFTSASTVACVTNDDGATPYSMESYPTPASMEAAKNGGETGLTYYDEANAWGVVASDQSTLDAVTAVLRK